MWLKKCEIYEWEFYLTDFRNKKYTYTGSLYFFFSWLHLFFKASCLETNYLIKCAFLTGSRLKESLTAKY